MPRLVSAFLLVLAVAGGAASTAHATEIRVLSNRADLISGGDALVQVVLPPGVGADAVRVDVDGRDVTGAFAVRADGRYVGRVEGLREGRNVLRARVPGRRGARVEVLNHPDGGPVTAGPQIQPWKCYPGTVGPQCSSPPRYEHFYKPTDGGGLTAYDPDSPPDDVATTTTDQGRKVPFVVRQEIGTIDRDQYRIAVLYDPAEPFEPWAPQRGFNHKLVIFHGASCDTGYEMGDAPDVLNETALGRGFATMSHALDNAGHNCNIATQAESLIMTKERLVERYGELRYTIGSGCSGGSLTQHQVANAYPGLYQGITPACSFPDAWSSAMLYVDYQLLRRYLENPAGWAPGVVWGPQEIQAVEGHPNPANAITFNSVIPSSGDPSRNCPGVPSEQVYDAQDNPGGVRCSLQDYMVAIFGRRPQDGFANRPADNVGVQYGLRALVNGLITPAQFADLNTKLGGWDIDYNPTAERVAADRPALERVYRSGAVNQADNLDEVAIIDMRGPDPGAFHDVYRTDVTRARLIREHGTAANQVRWRGQLPIFGDLDFVDESIVAIDRWLAAVERDDRDVPLARKILDRRPTRLTDRCTDGLPGGRDLPATVCDTTVQGYSSARIEAGMPLTDDTIKCELQPLERSDYPVTFTDAQWEGLRRAFPEGVCDYTKPGVDRVPTVPWLTYADGPGGRALGIPPRSQQFGPAPCTRSRATRIALARKGRRLRSATVFVDGRRVRTVRRRDVRAVEVRLPRGRTARTVRVRVVGRTARGRAVVVRRSVRVCAGR